MLAEFEWVADLGAKDVGAGLVSICIIIYGLKFLGRQISVVLTFVSQQNKDKQALFEGLSVAIAAQSEGYKTALKDLAQLFKEEIAFERSQGDRQIKNIVEQLTHSHEITSAEIVSRINNFMMAQNQINTDVLAGLHSVNEALHTFKGCLQCPTLDSLSGQSIPLKENMASRSRSKEKKKPISKSKQEPEHGTDTVAT